jgi:hypothetical protein
MDLKPTWRNKAVILYRAANIIRVAMGWACSLNGANKCVHNFGREISWEVDIQNSKKNVEGNISMGGC